MEIYQLRAFVMVAKIGHVTRAAEQLHLSQPAVSKQIKALEQELGVLLFERHSGGVALTREGQRLLPQAELALREAMNLMAVARSLRGEVSGAIVVGTIIDPETLRLGSFLGTLLAFFPKVQVRLQHAISGVVLDWVKSGEVDVGFYLGPVAVDDVQSMPLTAIEYVVVGPPDWRSRIEAADWVALSQMPWIGTSPNSSQHRLVREMFNEVGVEMQSVVEADQEASMVSLVRTGVGLATMRRDIAEVACRRQELCIWPGTVRQVSLSFLYRTIRADDPLIAACRKSLLSVWPQAGEPATRLKTVGDS
jgi:DNA-binding transcriptional LysR family regulator